MFRGRQRRIVSVMDPQKKRKRKILYSFRVIQVILSLCVLGLFYMIPSGFREDAITETCYPAVSMLLLFRVLTDPTAKMPFFYNLYVDTVGLGLYTVVGTADLYSGLLRRPPPINPRLHYTRLYLMLFTGFMMVADVLYIEFFEKNLRFLPEKMSIGNAGRAKIEIAMQKYNEQLAKREQEEKEREATNAAQESEIGKGTKELAAKSSTR